MKIHIQNDGGMGYMTRITDAETGKALDDWHIFRIELDAHHNEPPTAIIYTYMPVVNIIADAEIRQVCPGCGRPVEEHEQEEPETPYLGGE